MTQYLNCKSPNDRISSWRGHVLSLDKTSAHLAHRGTLKQIFDKSAEAKASLIEALFQQAASLQHNVKVNSSYSLLRPLVTNLINSASF
jgi:hypothetical protein